MIIFGDFVAFENTGIATLILIFNAYFIGFYIRGALGFGSNLPIVVMTAWVLDPHHAILLVALCSGIAQVQLLPQGFRHTDWAIVRMISVGMALGVLLGVLIFSGINADWLLLALGMLIIGIVLVDRLQLMDQLQHYINLRSHLVGSCLALVSGVVGTVSGGGGFYLLVAYLKFVCTEPEKLRSTIIFLAGAFMLLRLGLLTIAGLYTPGIVFEAAMLAPVAFLGSLAGTRLFHILRPEQFLSFLQWALLVAAMALFLKGMIFLPG